MATDATGTPTSPDNIPTFNVDVDAPSGLGFNAAMAAIQTALSSRLSTPAGIAAGEFPVWNGSTWVRSSTQRPAQSSLGTGTPSISTFLRGDGAWAPAVGSPYRKTTAKQSVNTTSVIDLLNGEVTIAAGAMGTDRVLRLTAWGDSKQNSGATTNLPEFVLRFGGTSLLDTNAPASAWANSATRYGWKVVCEIANLGASNSQWATMDLRMAAVIATGSSPAFFVGEGIFSALNDVAVAIGGNSGAVDTSVAQAFRLQVVLPVASANCDVTLKGAVVEIL